jgi:hypothetical protein
MSQPEAMVHLELERRKVPFSWRYFDATLEEAPHLKVLIPDFAPEFTLREYRIVIIVESAFFSGRVPGELDRTALALALLQEDGWKAAVLWEPDIRKDVKGLISKNFPQLVSPAVRGTPKENPYGKPEELFTFRRRMGSLSFARSKPKLEGTSGRNRRRTSRRRRRYSSRDGGESST